MRKELVYGAVFVIVAAMIIWLAQRQPAREVSAPDNSVSAADVAASAPDVPAPAATNDLPAPGSMHAETADAGITATNLPEEHAWLDDELIVRLDGNAAARRVEDALAAKGIIVMRRVGQLGLWRVKLPEGMSLPDAEALLRETDGIAGTARNLRTELPKDIGELPLLESGAPVEPVMRNGRALVGLVNPAEEISYGRNCLVAVLDTGIDQSHPDLMHSVLGGYNFVDDNADTRDLHGHGTACAGIITGSGQGADSVKGIAPKAHVIPVKVMNELGRGNAFSVIEGIVYAVDRGARVISLSIGSRGDCAAVRDAIEYAWRRGALVVAAAGNDGREGVAAPAHDEHVVGVGAVDGNLQRAPFSNYGAQLALVAPGAAVYTTARDKGYMLFSGTSAAVPFVAGGLAALYGSRSGLTAEDAMDALIVAADNLGSGGHDHEFGYGLLNVRRLLFSRTDRVYDLALTTIYFDPPELRLGMSAEVVFVVQNRGSRPVRGAKLITRIAGAAQEHVLGALQPSQCVELHRTMTIPAAMPDQTLRVEGAVYLREADADPANNGRVIVLQPSLWM